MRGGPVIAVTTVVLVVLVFLAWRTRAWVVALLGIVVGVTLTGPVADLVEGAVKGVQSAATTVDQVARDKK